MIRSRFSRLSLRRSVEAQAVKEKMCFIEDVEDVREEAETMVEYRDILSFTIICQLWHVADNIFKHLDAVSLLNCEKVTACILYDSLCDSLCDSCDSLLSEKLTRFVLKGSEE